MPAGEGLKQSVLDCFTSIQADLNAKLTYCCFSISIKQKENKGLQFVCMHFVVIKTS